MIQILPIVFQTDPVPASRELNTFVSSLMLIAAIMLNGAYLTSKQKPVDVGVLSVALVLIGSISLGVINHSHNALVDVFFPNSQLFVLLHSCLLTLIMAGVLLPMMARIPNRASPSIVAAHRCPPRSSVLLTSAYSSSRSQQSSPSRVFSQD